MPITGRFKKHPRFQTKYLVQSKGGRHHYSGRAGKSRRKAMSTRKGTYRS